jgi:aldose 1-epimerase
LHSEDLEVSLTNYGGAVVSLKTTDKHGSLADIVLGFETLEEYVRNPRYFGGLIGRHANRIGRGKFSLEGVDYQLTQNNGVNHLHGGFRGFDKRVWKALDQADWGATALRLQYLSRDGEEGYPGTVQAQVTYALSDNQLQINYEATTDRETIVNLTNHSYFNLAGRGDILGHELTLHADAFTPVTEDLIPTGEIRPVANSAMDFRRGKAIGQDLAAAGGYDHNFVLSEYDSSSKSNGSLRPAARLYEPMSGRVLEILTTEPGIQFYSGNFLNGSFSGKDGMVYEKYTGLCLEPQHFPDAPNHQDFPSTVLRPGETYKHVSVYRFSCD